MVTAFFLSTISTVLIKYFKDFFFIFADTHVLVLFLKYQTKYVIISIQICYLWNQMSKSPEKTDFNNVTGII